RLIGEGAARMDAVVHPVLRPVGRGREALLRKPGTAKALLLLQAARDEDIDIRLSDGVLRARGRDILGLADVDPGLRARRRHKVLLEQLDLGPSDGSAAIEGFAPV